MKKRILAFLLTLAMVITLTPAISSAADNDLIQIDSVNGEYHCNPGDTIELRTYAPLDSYTCKWKLTEGSDIADIQPDLTDSSKAKLAFKDPEDIHADTFSEGASVQVTVYNSKGKRVGTTFDYYECSESVFSIWPLKIPSDLAIGDSVTEKFFTVRKDYGKSGEPTGYDSTGFTWLYDEDVVSITDYNGSVVKSGTHSDNDVFIITRLSGEYTRIVVNTDIKDMPHPLFHAYYLDPIAGEKSALSVKKHNATVKYSKLKKKNQTIKLTSKDEYGETVEIPVIEANIPATELTFTKKSGNKKITVNSSTGKFTVKKGLKKGTYKVKVKVSTKGNKYFEAGSVTETVKIRVK